VGQIFLCKPSSSRPRLAAKFVYLPVVYSHFLPPIRWHYSTDRCGDPPIHLTPLCELLSICARRGHKEAILERVYRHWHCICIRGGQLKAPSRPAESASIELYNHMVRMVKWEKERRKWGGRNEYGEYPRGYHKGGIIKVVSKEYTFLIRKMVCIILRYI